MVSNRILICAFMLICLSVIGEAVKCYTCYSDVTPSCAADNFKADSSIQERDCDQIPQAPYGSYRKPISKCYKVVRLDGSRRVTHRGCFEENPVNPNVEDKCMTWKNPQSAVRYENCEVCDGNLCNSANTKYTATIGVSFVLLMLSVFLF